MPFAADRITFLHIKWETSAGAFVEFSRCSECAALIIRNNEEHGIHQDWHRRMEVK